MVMTGGTGIGTRGVVGIGTSTPDTTFGIKLDVNGRIKMTGIRITDNAATGSFLMGDASGLGGWQTPFIVGEIPPEVPDGVNDTFTTSNDMGGALGQWLQVYKNGLRQTFGALNDYDVISEASIVFNAGNIPQTGDKILFDYRII
jgi:hypothetical protein